MLWQRISTALFLFVFLNIAAFYFNALLFFLFLTVITAIAVWEWSRLAGFTTIFSRGLYSVVVIAGFILAWVGLENILTIVLIISLCFWVLAFLLVLAFPAFSTAWDNKYVLALLGILVLFPCWYGLLTLHGDTYFIYLFIGLFILVGAADTGAYFAGKHLGKHKLAARVSPNKTWEGVIGGLLCCIAITGLYAWLYESIYAEDFLMAGLIAGPLVVTAFSITGDLFESMIKRKRKLKDSGNILPGHGGILDRLDGVLAAAPAYLLSMQLFLQSAS